ncbi:MAG: hypothetical protein QOI19_2174, partial [Thermoleophilaceae bacterium]|nr:hypothetical protein [Thermoleophilaceae bacterium]
MGRSTVVVGEDGGRAGQPRARGVDACSGCARVASELKSWGEYRTSSASVRGGVPSLSFSVAMLGFHAGVRDRSGSCSSVIHELRTAGGEPG